MMTAPGPDGVTNPQVANGRSDARARRCLALLRPRVRADVFVQPPRVRMFSGRV
jgi:hypothetical protein